MASFKEMRNQTEPRQDWDEKEGHCITGQCWIKGLA